MESGQGPSQLLVIMANQIACWLVNPRIRPGILEWGVCVCGGVCAHMRVCVRARMCVRACMCVWRVCACMYVCVSVRAPTQSLQPHGLEPGRLLCPWNAPGKNPGAGRHFLLRGILDPRTEPASLHFLHWQADSPPLAPFSSVQLLSRVLLFATS